MKNSALLRLCMLAIVAAMVLSLFACAGDETVTTDAPQEETTEATTTEDTASESTEATTEATTAVTTEVTTEGNTHSTEDPTTETTEELTTETTEPEYPEVLETVTTFKTEANYYMVMTRENPAATLFLNGEMDGYYYGTTEDIDDAELVYLESLSDGYYIYKIKNATKYYLNIVKNGTYTNVVYDTDAVSKWNYDATLGTMVTDCEGTSYFLGTRNDKDYTTISACDVKYTENYKVSFAVITVNGEVKCKHPYVGSEDKHWKAACGHCGKAVGTASDHDLVTVQIEGEEYVIHSYECSLCGYQQMSYSTPAYINKYLGADYISDRTAGVTFRMSEEGRFVENGLPYVRFCGTDQTGQIIWTRIGLSEDALYADTQINPFDVGDSKYLVMKVRQTGTDIGNIHFMIGSIVGEASNSNFASQKAVNIALPQNNLPDGEWTYLVFDFTKAWSDAWVENGEGNHTVTYLQFTFTHSEAAPFTVDNKFDIAFMAFISDWSELDGIVDSETVEYIDAQRSSVAVDTITGLCVSGHSPKIEQNGTTYTHICTICGETVFEQNIPDSINKYITPNHINGLSHYQVGTKEIIYEDGFYYLHTANSQNTHIHIWTTGGGGGNPTDLGANTGRYLVMRFRTDMSKVSLGIYTANNSYGYQDRKQTATGEWETVVIDLSSFASYSTNMPAGTDVLIRINGFADLGLVDYYLDIAYVAIVDDLSEADLIIDEQTYDYYAKWTDAGVTYDTATGTPKVDDGEDTTESTEATSESREETTETPENVSTNYYNDFSSVTSLNHSTLANQKDGGVSFTRYFSDGSESTASNPMNFILVTGSGGGGNGTPTTESVVWGKYLVFKVRQSGLANINIVIGADNDNRGTTGAMTVFPGGSGDWGVAVIDISTVSKYSVGNNAPIYIRMVTTAQTAGNYSVDLSYVALADNLTAVEALVASMGNTSYTYYGDNATTTSPEVRTIAAN